MIKLGPLVSESFTKPSRQTVVAFSESLQVSRNTLIFLDHAANQLRPPQNKGSAVELRAKYTCVRLRVPIIRRMGWTEYAIM
jgi:hypothetical protein